MFVDLSPVTQNQTLSMQLNHNIHLVYIVFIGYFTYHEKFYIIHDKKLPPLLMMNIWKHISNLMDSLCRVQKSFMKT